MACKAMSCPAFQAGSCEVKKSGGGGEPAEMVMTPCPPDILCYSCFGDLFAGEARVGCLDDTYWRS